MDWIHYLGGAEFRSYAMTYWSLMVIGVSLACLLARGRLPMIRALGLEHVGITMGAVYFTWWNGSGRVEFFGHLLIANVGLLIASIGATWFLAQLVSEAFQEVKRWFRTR